MNKLFAAVLVAVSVSGFSTVFGCGGMTQIDPPALMVDPGPANTSVESVIEDLQKIVVLC